VLFSSPNLFSITDITPLVNCCNVIFTS
jgi:hypothetical protein